MNSGVVQLSARAARAALPFAAAFAVVYVGLGPITCLRCLYLFALPIFFLGLGYLRSPRPDPVTLDGSTVAPALAIGAGLAVPVTAAFGLGVIVENGLARTIGLWEPTLSFGENVSGASTSSATSVGVLLAALILVILWGLGVGLLFGTLGSYLSLRRSKNEPGSVGAF